MAFATPAADPLRSRFVLVGTSHAGNVGAAARAIKVMGFAELVLVAPRWPDVCSHEEAVAMASGAADVLTRCRVVPSLDDALDGCHQVLATAMTPRDFGPPTHAPRQHLPALAVQLATQRAADGAPPRVAFVFGSERYGMANDDVWRCHACLSIPTAPGYGSLNLSQAVQLIAYEWRQALGSFAVEPRTAVQPIADAAQLQGLLAHWQRVLVAIGFLDPAVPKKLMPRLRQLLLRARPTEPELHILHGIARATGASAGAQHDSGPTPTLAEPAPPRRPTGHRHV